MRHHRIDDHVIHLDLGILLADAPACIEKDAIGHLEYIVFVYQGETAPALHREFKCTFRDALATGPGDAAKRNRHVGRHQNFAVARLHVAVGVEALGVFANYDQIEGPRDRGNSRKGPGRPDVGKEIELLAKEFGRIDFAFAFVLEVIGGHWAQHQAVRVPDLLQQIRRDCDPVPGKRIVPGDVVLEREGKAESG